METQLLFHHRSQCILRGMLRGFSHSNADSSRGWLRAIYTVHCSSVRVASCFSGPQRRLSRPRYPVITTWLNPLMRLCLVIQYSLCTPTSNTEASRLRKCFCCHSRQCFHECSTASSNVSLWLAAVIEVVAWRDCAVILLCAAINHLNHLSLETRIMKK